MNILGLFMLAGLGLGAHADQQGFLKKVGSDGKSEYFETARPASQIRWFTAAERKRHTVNGKEMVAAMDDQYRQTITFDETGTAYLYYQEFENTHAVPISTEGGASEGYFFHRQWPYIIHQGQVFGLDDSWLKEKISHLGPLWSDAQHIRHVFKGIQLGVATLFVAMLGNYLGATLPSLGPWLLGPVAGLSYYTWLRMDRLKMTQMDLGFAGNRFSKKIKGLSRIIDAKPTLSGDVELTQDQGEGKTRTISMSELMATGRIKYRSKNCAVYLDRIRTVNVKSVN